MNGKILESAFAKINLMLDVAGILENGYHSIDGIMQAVSLADSVEVSCLPSEKTEINVQVIGDSSVPEGADNLAHRAADLFLQAQKKQATVEIRIEKRIPAAAGLAGGSSDAAATLRAMNRMAKNPFSANELCALGAQLGADVPFCILGGSMRTQGIGEKLTAVPGLSDCFLVICCAGKKVSTPWAYQKLDEEYRRFLQYPDPAPKVEKLIQVLRKGNLSVACACFENIFEPVMTRENPEIGRVRQILQTQGAVRSMMSGSGPSVFGVFTSQNQALSACNALAREGFFGQICKPVAQKCDLLIHSSHV